MTRNILNALLIVSLLLAASVETAAALPTAFEPQYTQWVSTPVADTYVLVTQPTKNYGSRTSLKTDGSPIENIYLKFNVQDVGAAPSAALRFYAQSSNSLGLNIHAVSNTGWAEGQLNWNNAPPIGTIVATTGPLQAGNWYMVDVSSAISSDGLVSLAITSLSSTATTISSRESSNPPELYIPIPVSESPDPFVVWRDGNTYHAESQTTSSSYSGSLKTVVQAAANELNSSGGGTITFQAGDFDLGADWFEFYDLAHVTFAGQGIDITILRNSTSASTDTEPFDFSNGDFITIHDMTVSAGGPLRSTSDAIDFDAGDNNLVERVKVTGSRGRGIVFDGKDVANGQPRTADGNVVLDCIITGIPSDGIELLASSSNRIEHCQIFDVGGHGIQITKASSVASQPNKKSNDNIVTGNYIQNVGQDGINLNSGDRNTLRGNTILNSSDDTSNQDGIQITSSDSIHCDDNVVELNTATDNQAVKTQRYGLSISSINCHNTVVADNNFAGNRLGDIQDNGTGTIYTSTDNEPPSVPTGLAATLIAQNQIDLVWNASTDNVGVTSYTIYRDGTPINSVGGGTTIYQDNTVTPDTAYTYTVAAFDAAGNGSGQSAPLPVITPPLPPDTAPPSLPTNLRTTNVGYTAVDLAWDASTDNVGVTGYTIYRDGAPVGSVNGATTTYSDGTVAAGATYSYTVEAFDAAGNGSGQSAPLPVTTPSPDLEPPSIPANLRTTNVNHLAVDLAWDASTDNIAVTGYTIYRDGAPLGSVDGATTTYQDGTVAADTSYTYTVEAFDAAGNGSGQSAPLPVTTLPAPPDTDPPGVPTNLRTTNVAYTSVDLAWDASTDNVGVTGYTIYRDGAPLGSVDGATTTYSDNSVAAGASYTYTVEAFDAAGNGSGQSASLPVVTPPIPSTLTFVAVADAYVEANSPTTNRGSSTTLRVDGSPVINAYLRFEVQGIVGSATQATLRVYANSSSSVGFDARGVNDNNWDERTINYSNAPGFGSAVASSGPFSGGNWIAVDVTLLINGDGTYSLAMTTPHTTAISFASRESANPPELVVNVGP